LHKIEKMSTKTEDTSTRMDWLLFLGSTAIMVFMLAYADEWFWLALPFSLTFLVRALRAM